IPRWSARSAAEVGTATGCRYLKAIAAYTRKTTFHSLRHNYRDALRDTEMSGEIIRALGCWAGSGTSDDYDSELTPERLDSAMQAVRYEWHDLSHLYSTL